MPIEIVRNDITKMEVDAIVNAAKSSLLGGGGVDGCIHHAAGPELLEECKTLGGCATGHAKLTNAYRLPCRYVIHTVGPIWRDGAHGEHDALASCYRNSLTVAKENGCESIAFPLISSGAYGYPKDQALRIAIDTISEFLMENDMMVYLVVFDRTAFQLSEKLFADITEYIDDNYIDYQFDSRHSRRRRFRSRDEVEFSLECGMPCEPVEQYNGHGVDAPFGEIDYRNFVFTLDTSFSGTLLKLIDRSGKTDAQIYNKANIDRRLFSKIKTNMDYKPTKATALAFAIALELNLEETNDLIGRAGYTLSHSSKFDTIVEFFIKRKIYNVFEINDALYHFTKSSLGLTKGDL